MFGPQTSRKGAVIYSGARRLSAPRDASKRAASAGLAKPKFDFLTSKSATLLETRSVECKNTDCVLNNTLPVSQAASRNVLDR